MNMNKNTTIALVALIIVLSLTGWFYMKMRSVKPIQVFDSQTVVNQEAANDRSVGIEEYIKRNISGISAEAGYPEQVGGTYQVTDFKASKGSGTVSYEDGHNAYTAAFTYSTDKKGIVTVTSFTVSKK